MEVIVAKTAGFCFGVKRAVEKVYANADNEHVYTYGPIIHNEQVVADLEKHGVRVVEEDTDLSVLPKGTVVVRAHGASRDEFDRLRKSGMEIEDATCPFVSKIYRIVEEESAAGRTVVIVGNAAHPEVKGIKGWSGADTYVVGSVEEAKNINILSQKISIVSQTTFNLKKFQEIVEIFDKKDYDIKCLNTICNATEVRQTEARQIASQVDAMIVIGGKNSSNTQKLFEICKEECSNTYYIQTAEDMDFTAIRGMQRIGITAGASTPKNIIEEVQTRCQI
jgi:4-hydroxy-3-methylbut-2-enyl diphosphate reductase